MKHLFTLSERSKDKLVGMVKLFMPFMKATRRQSDTTFFAVSLKSLMSIFAESAESAKSAKPIFANRGVKDVRVSLAQYPTNIQRISNLYLTPNRYFTRFAAVFTLVFVLGVGNVWGETYVMYPNNGSTFNSSWTRNSSRTARQAYQNITTYGLQLMGESSGNYGEVTSNSKFTGITAISVSATANGSKNLELYYSANGSSWTNLTQVSITKDQNKYNTYNYTLTGLPSSAIYIKLRASASSIYLYSITITTGATKTLSSISVQTAPTKKKYVAEETFDPTGLVITRTYSDATSDTYAYAGHTSDFTFSPTTSASLTTSNTSVSITYGGKSTSQSINVYNVTLQARDVDGNTIPAGGPGAPSRTGKSITPAADANNYVFKQWQVTNASLGSGATAKSNTITNPTGAVTVTAVYYKPIPVSWNKNGSLYETTYTGYNQKPVFPEAPSSCDLTSNTFYGWATSTWDNPIDNLAGKTVYTSADGMPNVTAAGTTYNAVFAKGTATVTPVANTWTRITSTSQLTDGATVMLVQYYSKFAINNTPGATACTANAEITNSTASLRWIAEKSGTKWKFKTSGGAYLSTNALDNNTNLGLNQTYDEWTISADNGGTTGSNNTYTNTNCFRLNNGSDLEYYSGVFKLYTWSLKYSSAYPFYIYIQKTTSTTTYSQYLTSCCTPLAQVNGSVNVNQTRNSATVSWGKLTNAAGYEYKLDEGEWTNTGISGDDLNNATQSFTISGLEGAHTYHLYLRGIGDGENNCSGGGAIKDCGTFTTLSRVTAASNNGGMGTAQVSLTSGSGWADYVDATNYTDIYLKATPASDSYEFSSWGATSGDVEAQSAETTLTGWSGDVTVTANFVAKELTELDVPTNMSSDVTAISATVHWNAVDNASDYAVNCSGGTPGAVTESAGVCSCTITGLNAGTAYTWSVKALGDGESYKNGAACADQNFTTEVKKPTAVEITHEPTVTEYLEGENFAAAGMVVKVTYNTGEVDAAYTGYTVTPNGALEVGTTAVTISATLNETTASTTQAITVHKKYTLTFKNNGVEVLTRNLKEGDAYGDMDAPAAGLSSCDGTSTTFIGWSTWESIEKTDAAPTFATAETTMGTANVVLNAVWAKEEGGGGAAVNTVLWSEDFSGFSSGNALNDSYSTGTGRTVYNNGSVTYACQDGNSATKLYDVNSNNKTGGESPEILINKKNTTTNTPGRFTISGIPTGNAAAMTLTYRSNSTSIDVSSETQGITIGERIGNNPYSQIITVSGDLASFDLAFTNSSSENIRMDNYNLVVTTTNVSYSGYVTSCCTPWDAPAISYSVPGGWKNGDAAVAVTIAAGTTHGTPVYESSNTAVLTVDANTGAITAVGPGVATVTATWPGETVGVTKYCEQSSVSAEIEVTGTVTVMFDGNGASEGSMSNQEITYKTATALTANGFSKTGYTFGGWALTADGAKEYDNQQSVTLTAGCTLYAIWNINSHAITVTQPTGNTITATGAANLASVAYNTEITLTAEENDGYVFTGWDVTGATVVDANAKSTTFTMPDNDVVVSANYSTYNWISTGYSVTTAPRVAYTKVEKFSTAGVVIKENFKRSDNESLTKQEVYTGAWTAKLNGEAIANGADLSLSDNGKTLILYISGNEIASYTLTVSDIATDQFIDGLWGETFDPQIEAYAMPTPSTHDAGSVAECKDHNIFVGWVEEANADEPTDENIIAGGTPGQTAANKTYYAVWAKQVEQDLPAGYRMVTEVPTTGTNVILAAKSGNKYYALTTDLEAQQLSFENGAITTSTSNLIFSYATADSKKVFKVGTNTYIHFNSSSFKVAQQTGNANVEITKVDDGAFKIKGTENTKYLTFSNEGNNPSFSTTSTEDDYSPIYIFKDQAASKILVNTDYITDCVTRYEISYNANGGEGSYESVKKKAGATVTLPDGEVLSKEHHDFAGWKADNVGELLNGGSEFTVGTANVAFYAQWSEWSKATVTFKNGEETVGTPAVVYRGENYTTPAAPVVAGKLFQGWSDGVNTYAAETEVAVPNDLTENITITYNALWKDVLPIPEAPAITAADLANGEWVLVTANSQIKEGDVVIVAKAAELNATSTIAMGNQHTDGSKVWREYESVEKSGNKITPKANVPMLFVQVGYGDNQYALYAINGTIGYLYDPQSSGNHYLNTGANLTTAASWTIAINANNEAEITNGASSKVLRYNAQNPRFSCYANGQQAVALYKWVKKISGDMDISDVTLTDAVIVEDGATLTIDEAATLDNLTVEAGGKVDGSGNLTVNDFTIEGQDGKSGQVMNAHKLTINGDAYFDFTLAVSGTTAANQWHNFSVPFPVSVMDGVYNAETGAKLTNEVDYAIEDYHGDLRAQGKYGWKKYRGIMQPGITYSMTVNGDIQTFRFKKVAGAYSFDANPSVGFSQYTSGENTNAGWNGLGNMRLCYASVNNENIKENNSVRYVQILNATEYAYKSYAVGEINLTVGSAFFIQAANNGTMTFAAAHNAPNIVYAPARTEAKRTDKPIAVTLSNENQSDRMYITASEDAKSEYQIGCDLQKMFATNTPQAPMIYSVNYGGIKLAAEEAPMVNDKASYALSLYAPADGTYRIETPTESDNADLYLTKDGHVIWNLSMNGYEVELTKGTTEGYGLLLVRKAPSVATGVDEVESQESKAESAEKVIIDEHVYILRGGQMYDVTGKAVK